MENQVLVAASIFADVFDYRQEGNVLYIYIDENGTEVKYEIEEVSEYEQN